MARKGKTLRVTCPASFSTLRAQTSMKPKQDQSILHTKFGKSNCGRNKFATSENRQNLLCPKPGLFFGMGCAIIPLRTRQRTHTQPACPQQKHARAHHRTPARTERRKSSIDISTHIRTHSDTSSNPSKLQSSHPPAYAPRKHTYTHIPIVQNQ